MQTEVTIMKEKRTKTLADIDAQRERIDRNLASLGDEMVKTGFAKRVDGKIVPVPL